MTTRRRFLLAAGAGVVTGPRRSLAQAPSRVARIGYLYFGSRQSSTDTGRYGAFVQGLRDLGYVEGKDFTIEARYADGKLERATALAAEMVRLKVDVVVATGTATYRALQHATTTIPIVVTVSNDPVGDGFAASMARPGRNFTGLAFTAADLGPKILELLRVAVPKLSRVAVLSSENPAHPLQFKRIVSAAQKVGIQIVLAEATTMQDVEREFSTMRERANAVIVLPDVFFLQESRTIAAHALKHRLPLGSPNGEFAEAGGLMTYGPNAVDNFRRAATYVDKILKGAKPGDLPFEQPTRYYLVLNRKTAATLGLAIPDALLRQADEVIQ